MRSRLLLIGIVGVVSLAVLVAVNVAYHLKFNELNRSLDNQLGDQLSGLAEALAATIPAETAGQILGESFSPEAYLRTRDLTKSFAASNHLVSVALLDTLWQDPFADRPDSLNQLVYSLLDRDGRWALLSGLSWTSPTYRWGDAYYRSAAAPITDTTSGRTMAIVRLEADASYFGALSQLRRLAWWVHLSSAALTVLLVGLFAWYTRRALRWESQLLHSEKLIGLGRLAATIAHEIRNPLGIIKATAQRLERVSDEKKRAELLRFIPEEADRLNRILGGYLRLGSQQKSQPVAISMEQSLSAWLEKSFGPSETGHRRWTIVIQPTGPIMANPDTPPQVLLNLMNNAFDATPAGEIVAITWGPGGQRRGRLTVADRGPGIPKKMRARVFEPFFTTKIKGSGLGLYAVKTMVEQDGGQISTADNPGGGTAFHVEWPLAGERNNLGIK